MSTTPQAEGRSLPRPTLYYDGACPVCTREIALYRRQPGADGVCWVDVSQCGPEALGPGLNREAALARLHLRQGDGRLVSGAAAFVALWQALPGWARWGRALAWPPLLAMLEAGYRGFLVVRRLWRRPR